MGGMGAVPPPVAAPVAATPAGAVTTVSIVFQGVHRDQTSDADLAYTVLQCVTNTPSFASAVLSRAITPSPDDTNTITFSMIAQLKRPLKL
jgi:hypothetical protein